MVMDAAERITRIEMTCHQVTRDVEEIKSDFYDEGDRLGVKSKVRILWYSAAYLIGIGGTLFGTLLGYLLRGVLPQ